MIDQAGIMMANGKTIAAERIQGINDNMSKSHFHEYFELYYLEDGERYHMINDKIYLLHLGEFIIFPPYVMHHSYSKEDIPFKRLLIYFRKEEIDSRELLKKLENGTAVYKPNQNEKAIIHRLLCEILKEQENSSDYYKECIHNLLNLILIFIGRDIQNPIKPKKQNRITSIIKYIHINYYQDISLENLAQLFYISPYHLCREFKKYTNSTIIQYLNTTRILNAQRMLMETDKNVTQVSQETGFSNVTHFDRVFKSVVGMTPTQSKKVCRQLEI